MVMRSQPANFSKSLSMVIWNTTDTTQCKSLQPNRYEDHTSDVHNYANMKCVFIFHMLKKIWIINKLTWPVLKVDLKEY